jgi:hypothetical protein
MPRLLMTAPMADALEDLFLRGLLDPYHIHSIKIGDKDWLRRGPISDERHDEINTN